MSCRKMKILIITQGFFPAKNYGGPPVSIKNMCNLISNNAEFCIITSNHELNDKNNLSGIKKGWNTNKIYKVKYLSDKEFNLPSLSRIVDEVNPDMIYLNSLFAQYTLKFLIIAKLKRIKTLLAIRGEICEGAFKKKYKKIPYIMLLKISRLLKNVYFQSTSIEEYNAVLNYLTTDESKVFNLTNIPAINKEKANFQVTKNTGSLNIIYVSRIVPKKNLLTALEILNDIKYKIKFDIYGPIEDSTYWAECEAVKNRLPSNIEIYYKGIINHEDIPKIFTKYDVFLFPTLSENYGHIIIESLASKCPIILSKDTTPWNDINDFCGYVVALDDLDEFRNKINYFCDLNSDDIKKIKDNCVLYIERKFDFKKIKSDYLKMFYKILKDDE